MQISGKRLHPAARLPRRAHMNDAGADLYATEPVTVPAEMGGDWTVGAVGGKWDAEAGMRGSSAAAGMDLGQQRFGGRAALTG